MIDTGFLHSFEHSISLDALMDACQTKVLILHNGPIEYLWHEVKKLPEEG
jgi:hypothetical protein